MNEDQLTLASNFGTDCNDEFAGIKFIGTGTDTGFLRVETNRTKSDATMTFQVRQSNSIIKPLDIASSITAYRPIIRTQWSGGELIKTTIFSRASTGVSKVGSVAPGTTLDWLFPTITTMNSPSNSIIVMSFDAPYHYWSFGTDALEMIVYDTTGGTANVVFKKTQYYDGNGGGGTRSSPMFPFIFSHTPSQATSTYTRTYQISITNRSANDTLYLCQGSVNNALVNMDYYTCEMKEIKV